MIIVSLCVVEASATKNCGEGSPFYVVKMVQHFVPVKKGSERKMPLVCGIAQTEATEKAMSAGMFTLIIGGGILCCCGPLFIVTAYIMYRFCRHN